MTHNPFPELAKLEGFIVLAGAGKMGGAMLDGWMASGLDPKQVIVLEPSPSPDIKALATKGLQLNPAHAPEAPIAALIVAVKPQMFADAAATLKSYVASDTLVLSIMAGQTRHAIARALGGAVVRTMPNTPAAIGRGITVAIAADNVTNRQRALTDQLLAATGALAWIEDESLMDAVTAVSGSGPAYVFLLAEELARAGVKAGLPPALAAQLARDTVSGAGELLHRSDVEAATLRQNVTSPGGTTAAALAVLMANDGLGALMTRAVDAATKRSRELGK